MIANYVPDKKSQNNLDGLCYVIKSEKWKSIELNTEMDECQTPTMDIRNRMLLQHHQQDIVKDLDVNFILDELFTNNAISNEVFAHIYNLTDRVDRARYLLDTLLQSGNNSAFNAFVDSLAKDYKWLWEKLAVENNKTMIEDSFEDNLSRGDVPRLPDHFVRRMSLERDVLVKLKSLNRHQILVLHGMSGCGKTALTISVLRSNPLLITSDFNGVMFWFNFSDCKTDDDIIAQQNKLYRKASSLSLQISQMKPTISMSSICSNGDSMSSYDLSWQELRDRLKTLFAETQLKDALLVLDELNEKKCLEAFDIGCRILVTTRDTDVVSNFNPQIVKIENHFSEEESLALFASCLDIEVSNLPRQAKRLHEICKGSPFHIALIGAELAENKEKLVHGTRHWNYYLNKLEKKDLFLHEQNVEEIKHSTIDVKETITAVCFLGDYVLIGTITGVIMFFHIATNKLRKQIQGTESAIKWLGVCPVNPPFVASLSTDGFIKLWYIDDVVQEATDDVIEEETEESYNNNYPTNVTILPNLGPFINCRWANNEETLITNTYKMIILYNTSGKVLHLLDNLYRDKEILRCIPCNSDKHVIVATSDSSHTLEVVDLKTKERQIFKENETILDLATIPGSNRILGLKRGEVTEYKFEMTRRFNQNCNNCQSKIVVTSDVVKENVYFISMAVNKTGTLLFVSTDDSRVICVDLKTNSYVFELENRRGNVVSMAVSEVLLWDDFEPGSDVLLTGTGCVENTAKVWYLDAAYISHNTQLNGKVRLTKKFDASFINILSPHTPVAPPPNSVQSANATPKRHQSFVSSSNNEVIKRTLSTTMSLDRHALKPLNLKGICNGNNEGVTQPLLAVVDDKNNIQIMRGRKLVSEISTNPDEQITTVTISPCNQYVIFGLHSGIVRRYTIRTKATKDIMDVYSTVQYMSFVNPNLLMVAGKNRCLMAYRSTLGGDWKPEMLQRGNTNLGSQEILNDIKGITSKQYQSDMISSSGSDSSITSRDRHFPNGDRKNLCKATSLVNCYWIQDIGLITIESNATVKLWDENLILSSVLNSRQIDVCITCSDFKKNVLVICDSANLSFQTFELKRRDSLELRTIQEYKLNNRICSCALTADGNILAMGLDSGDVVVWNVRNKRQLKLLKHHKTKVQYCAFSPIPERLYRSSVHAHSPSANMLSPPSYEDDSQPPLVLVTMATEIVWWNITYVIRTRNFKVLWNKPGGWNVVTPVTSPIDPRNETPTYNNSNTESSKADNFFFGGNCVDPKQYWKANWKKKT
ncbi:jg23441 [Pararge aegeria aegeria]|uniref:Jg23441 protein n=1 Tax=Pararge aegeria aegeria TaxID=348720 RepID=A0A8S4S335_9NEOP|nr:jg23441 [Pararge aegeria aegeria]